MDVTFSPIAGASLRSDGAIGESSGGAVPSFDLFLDFNESVVPNPEPEPPPEQEMLNDRDALKRVEGREDQPSQEARKDSADTDRDRRQNEKKAAGKSRRSENERSKGDGAASNHDADASTADVDDGLSLALADKLGGSLDEAAESLTDESSLAGAQMVSGSLEETVKKSTQSDLNLQALASKSPAENAFQMEADASADAPETSGVEVLAPEGVESARDADFQSDPTVMQNVQVELDDGQTGLDDVSEADSFQDDSLAAPRPVQRPVEQSLTDGNPTTKSEQDLGQLTQLGKDIVESRFDADDLKELAPTENSSDLQEEQLDDVDAQLDADFGEAEWSRLLLKDTPTEKLARKASLRGTDSVQLSNLGTKVGGDGPVGRGPAIGPGAVNQPMKSAATAATKQAQAPTPGQLPDGVDEMSILRQISDGLRLKSGRLQRAEIQLNPQELGTVRINLEMRGDAVRMVVNAEHAAVGELLSNGLEHLRRDLLAQGLHVEHVEVRSELPNESGQQGRENRESSERAERDVQEASVATPGRRHNGQISVRA